MFKHMPDMVSILIAIALCRLIYPSENLMLMRLEIDGDESYIQLSLSYKYGSLIASSLVHAQWLERFYFLFSSRRHFNIAPENRL